MEFVNTKSKAMFYEQLASEKIQKDAIVFIEETKEIWANGVIYGHIETLPIHETEVLVHNAWNGSSGSGSYGYYPASVIGEFEEV